MNKVDTIWSMFIRFLSLGLLKKTHIYIYIYMCVCVCVCVLGREGGVNLDYEKSKKLQ